MGVRTLDPAIMIRDKWIPDRIAGLRRSLDLKSSVGRFIRECAAELNAQQTAELVARISRSVVIESSLSAAVLRPKYDHGRGLWVPTLIEDHGIVSRKVITTAGVGYLVDAWQNLTELENMKYHGIGTGGTAEAIGDTALVTESTTALNPDSTRATGSLTEGASANIFRTVGTLTADASIANTEHGLFSQAATGGGTLWDRSLYSVVNLASGDSLQATYDMTATAGG